MDRVSLYQSASGKLTLKHSRLRALGFLLLLGSFWAVVSALLLFDEGRSWQSFVFLGVTSAMMIPHLAHCVRVVLRPSHTFDPNTQTIKRNQDLLASFPEVKAIEVQTVEYEYRVRLQLAKGTSVQLARISSRDNAEEVAAAVADLLAVPIHEK